MNDATSFSSADRESMKFDGKEFGLFKKIFTNILRAKKLEHTIIENVFVKEEQNEMKEAEKKEIQKDKEKSQAVFSALYGALSRDLQRLFQHVPDGDAHALWTLMCKKFESKTVSNRIHVRGKLMASQMNSGENFDAYLSRINELVAELNGMGHKTEQEELCCILLSGLPSSYKPLIQTIEYNATQDKPLDYDSVCEHVRNYQEKESMSKTQNESANFSSTGPHVQQAAAGAVGSTMQQQAYFGMPQSSGGPWLPAYQQRGGSNNGQRGRQGGNNTGANFNCYQCGEHGHRKFDCPQNKDKKRCFNCFGIGHEARECRTTNPRSRNRNQGRTSTQGGNNRFGGTQQTNYLNHVYDEYGNEWHRHEYEQAPPIQHVSYFSSEVVAESNVLSKFDYTKKKMKNSSIALFNEDLKAEAAATPSTTATTATQPAAATEEVSIVLDSGTTSHVAKCRSLLHDVHAIPEINVRVANNGVVNVQEAGSATLCSNDGSTLVLKDVLFSPAFAENLLSVPRLIDSGHRVVFSEKEALILDEKTRKLSMRVPRAGNLYVLKSRLFKTIPFRLRADGKENFVQAFAVSHTAESKRVFDLWHRRFGHLGQGEMKKLVRSGAVEGIDPKHIQLLSSMEPCVCDSCSVAKAQRQPFGLHKSETEEVKEIGDLFVSDIAGPIFVEKGEQIESLGGMKYLLTATDVQSRKVYGWTIRAKSDAGGILIAFFQRMKVELGRTIKAFHSDGGSEFLNGTLQSYFRKEGIRYTYTTKGTPQHNGIAERLNRTLFSMARALLADSKLPPTFWATAIHTAIYIRNRCINASNPILTPEQLWKGKGKPKVAHMRAFGCNAYIHVQDQERKKLDAKANRGIFVGYSEEQGGAYRVYNLLTERVEVSRDVQFDESSFTFAGDVFKGRYREVKYSTDEDYYEHHTFENESKLAQLLSSYEKQQDVEENKEEREEENERRNIAAAPSSSLLPSPSLPSPSPAGLAQEEAAAAGLGADPSPSVVPSSSPQVQQLRRSTRERKQVWKMGAVDDGDVAHLARLEMPLMQHTAKLMVQDVSVPTTFKEAMEGMHAQDWKQAMEEEYGSLIENHTFNLVEMPQGPERNLVGCKWVFSLKANSDGSIERFKARLVAQGFTQKEGIDFSETFAPSLKLKTFRILAALAALYDLEMKHLDVKTAFLNAEVEEEIYMKQPPGFHEGELYMVCKLLKGLYGLRQASRNWNENLNSFILSLGFRRCQSDTCVYVKHSETGRLIIIAVFVDDIIPLYSSKDAHEWGGIQDLFMRRYKMKDLGDAEWILGMKLTRDRSKRTLVITQETYVNKILTQHQMQNSNSSPTPSSDFKLTRRADRLSASNSPLSPFSSDRPVSSPHSTHKLTQADCGSPSPLERTTYQSIVGALIYSSISTRADITQAVNVLSRFMISPGPNHLIAAKRVLRYLRGTATEGLTYQGGNGEELTIDAYTDATWGEDSDTRRSTTGYVIKLNGCTVSWASKLQKTVSLSSAEAEYMALSATGQEVIWIKKLLSELYVNVHEMPTRIWCDNQAAVEIASDDQHHDRTKHIDLRYHWIRDSIKRGDITIQWISTHDQIADALTKALGPLLFNRMKLLIMSA